MIHMMNILLCGDKHVFSGIELLVYSLLTHNKNCNIYIFTMNISIVANNYSANYEALGSWEENKLKKIAKYLDSNSNVVVIDVANYYKEYLENSVNACTGFTPYAALRLISHKVLPDIDHIMYFDCDTAVRGNIEQVYNNCIHSDKEMYAMYAEAACEHEGEMVSGVMILNLNKIRQSKSFDKAIDNYNKNHYTYPDQMAIRDAYNVARLPANFVWIDDKIMAERYNPPIYHFTNRLNPKIYSDNEYGLNPRTYFYKCFPEFEYVKLGAEMIDHLNITY